MLMAFTGSWWTARTTQRLVAGARRRVKAAEAQVTGLRTGFWAPSILQYLGYDATKPSCFLAETKPIGMCS